MSLPWSVNLKKGDRVLHAPTKRPGSVLRKSRGDSRMIRVQWQGGPVTALVDVMDLRLILGDGTTETVPPVDGTPPEAGPVAIKRPPAPSVSLGSKASALENLREERERIRSRLEEIRCERDRLEDDLAQIGKAIDVLAPPILVPRSLAS